MDFDELRQRACASLALMLPQVEGSERLVDECLASARLSFHDAFILQLSPQAWAHIALVHATAFLDTQVDVPVGDIVAAVLRDSIHLHRIDMLAQQVAQERAVETPARRNGPPTLSLVKGRDPQ